MATSCARVETGFDRISSLPHDVRIHILSFLPTTYSVSTSVLSQEWRYLWKFVPTTNIDLRLCSQVRTPLRVNQFIVYSDNPIQNNINHRLHQYLPFLNNSSFQHRVDQLLLDSDSPVRNIYLHNEELTDLSKLNSWIQAAIRRQVRELDIYFHVRIPSDPILSLSSCHTLDVLKLRGKINIRNVPAFSFPRVKLLHLRDTSLAAMPKLYRGCQMLEELVLDVELKSSDAGSYKIFIPTLKKLSIKFRRINSRIKDEQLDFYCEFQIGCPALESLHIVGPDLLCNMVDLPLLRKTTVDLGPSYYFKLFTPFVELLNAMANSGSPYLSLGLQMTDKMTLYMSGTLGLWTSI